MKEKKSNFELLPIPEVHPQENKEESATAQRKSIKIACNISFEMIEKVRDYAYWEGLIQEEIFREALELYLKDKKIKSRPERIKMRPRRGRKPKQDG